VNEPLLISCDMDKSTLPILGFPDSAFSAIQVQGTGLKIQSQMLQCVEHVHETSTTTKDKVGGGTTTVKHKSYFYNTEWRDYPVNSGLFKKKGEPSFAQNCGRENPPWPTDVPTSTELYAPFVDVGKTWKLEGDWVHMIPLATPVPLNATVVGWTSSAYEYQTFSSVGGNNIGSMKVQFFTNYWGTPPTLTILGSANSDGVFQDWVASDSWMCSGHSLKRVEQGQMTSDALFENMRNENTMLTWVCRLGFFVLFWAAFNCMFGPLEVAADCIPCIGPYLGDSISCITCCVSCLPAFACTVGIIGFMYVFLRPMIGIPLMLVFVVITVAFFGYIVQAKVNKKSEKQYQQQAAME